MALEASEVAVRVRLIGGSAFQAEAEKVAGSTELIGSAGKKANESAAATSLTLGAAGSKLTSVGNKMIGFGRTLTMVGVPLAAAGGYAMKAASGFNQQMTLLSTQANESAKNIGWMSNAVLSMSKNFGQLPVEMAKGLYSFESVGIHGRQALNDIRAAAMGSAVGLDSLANTSDAVSSAMASHIKGVGGPLEAMSLMDRAIGMGKMHLTDLTEAMKSGIVPLAQTFHLDFNSVLANIAGLTGPGMPAGQTAARMRLMLTSMESPTTAGSKALAKVGITDPFALAKIMQGPGGLMGALQFLQMHLALLPAYEQNAVLSAVFGRSRGMGQIAATMGQLTKILQIYDTLQTTTPGTLQQHFAQTENTPAFKYAKLHAQLDSEMIKLGTTLNTKLLPVFVRMVPYVTKLLDGFSRLPGPVQDVALGLMGLAVVGGPLFLFGGALVREVGLFMTGMETLVGVQGMASLQAGLSMAGSSMLAFAPEILAATAAIGGLIWFIKSHTGQHVAHVLGQAGRHAGDSLVGFLHGTFGILGGANRADQIYEYLHGREFNSYDRNIKRDIRGLLDGPKTYESNHLEQVYNDLATLGKNVNIQDIPGLSQAIKDALKEGMKDVRVGVYLPNGRVLAQTVNEVNRKAQNRR